MHLKLIILIVFINLILIVENKSPSKYQNTSKKTNGEFCKTYDADKERRWCDKTSNKTKCICMKKNEEFSAKKGKCIIKESTPIELPTWARILIALIVIIIIIGGWICACAYADAYALWSHVLVVE